MPISITAAAFGSPYAVQVKFPGQTRSAPPTQASQQATKAQAAVVAAQQALASANSIVDQDKRNHSPGCVACDQKLVDKTQIKLAQAESLASIQADQTLQPPGSMVDITV